MLSRSQFQKCEWRIYTRQDIVARCRDTNDVGYTLQRNQHGHLIRHDVIGRHNEYEYEYFIASYTGRGRHWNFDPLQCLGPRSEILDRYISLSCLRWLPTACHERLVYFHWPQWVTWLVTWWVTWSRWPDAGRHIGKFSLWTTLLRFSRSAQISLFSNFTKLGQLFFDNIFFALAS